MFQRSKLLIPSLITLCNLLCGFLSIVYSVKQDFAFASQLILIGIVLDFLDGFIARRLKAESKFGLEFDSLADFITFGVAPSLMVYLWALKEDYDNIGIIASFTYLSSISFRLARFNSSDLGLIHFRGLPSPAAALGLAVLPLAFGTPSGFLPSIICLVLLLLLAALCSSKLVYLSLKKDTQITRRQAIWASVLIIILWSLGWPGVFGLAYLYILSGPVIYVLKLLSQKKTS